MTAETAFKNWIGFMNDTIAINTPRRMSSEEVRKFCDLIKKELAQMEEDDRNFFMGGGMS